MEKIIQAGFAVAAGIFISQAGYALFTETEKNFYLSYLQTGLLFIILGYLEKLRLGLRCQAKKNIKQ